MVMVTDKTLNLIDPISLEVMCNTIIPNSNYCKITDNHVFIKHSNANEKEWTVVSLKETKLCTINRGIETKVKDEKNLQYLIANE